MKKKFLMKILLIIMFMITILILLSFIFSERMVLCLNWGINLPKVHKIEKIIDTFVFRDGESLEIWHFKEKNKNKFIDKKEFIEIDISNIDFIKSKIDNFYKLLDENNKQKFDSNIDMFDITSNINYYAYFNKEDDERCYLLLILDYNSNKLYIFNNIY